MNNAHEFLHSLVGDGWNLINELACLIVFGNAVLFYIFMFGREGGIIYKRHIFEQYALRIGLLTIGLGSLVNVVTYSYPPIQEIVINIGLAFLFSWAAHFHYHSFIKKSS